MNSCIDNSPEQRFDFKGKVVSINQSQKLVEVNHEKISGYKEAATTPFEIKEDWAFQALKSGDSISATLVVKGKRTFLENLVISSDIEGNPTATGQRYDLKGKIVSIDQSKKEVTVSHEEIPGFMKAMIMPFELREEWAYKVLKPGDEITATMVIRHGRTWLEDLVVRKEGGDIKAPVITIPKSGEVIPDFKLVNQDGKKINLKNYSGKALILTFIYTRCPLPDYCPLMNRNFKEIQKTLKKDVQLYEKVHLLSVSFDSNFDTPKVLSEYGANFIDEFEKEKFSHWEFASGTEKEIEAITSFFGLQYWPGEGQINHSLRTALISPDGKLIKLYNGNKWKSDEVMLELKDYFSKQQ